MGPLFAPDTLPPKDAFAAYCKRGSTLAARINGPFRVATSEGEMECTDGYLALDAVGSPYPIAAGVFQQTYEPTNQLMTSDAPPPVRSPEHAALERAWNIQHTRETLVRALLQNPRLHEFTYGFPFETRQRCGDHPSLGSYLAHHLDRLAEDLVDASKTLDDARQAAARALSAPDLNGTDSGVGASNAA
ncbi:MAG: hypothetical protein AB7N70_36325 [Dehalococcoidia bacterium]